MELLKIANKEFESRLFVGTGKFASNALMADAIAASGTQMVTVALRRVDIENENDDMLRCGGWTSKMKMTICFR
jgi:thiazole synthase